ncbi:MAG: DUF2860 family protein [Burkholderiales bacterium]|nr:DUF2860 family protein [Burkholderiales bacterium]
MASKCAFVAATLVLSLSASYGFEPIPSTPGVSGFVNAGVAYVDAKSNMLAGNDFGDLGQRTIGSLTSDPGSQSDWFPLLNFELAYTFATARTQVVLGNRLEDFVTFDTTTQLAVRTELPDSSIVGLGYVFNSIPTEVWSDPYVVNVPRSATDRHAPGLRLEYSYILGSNFGAELTRRKVDIDDERSGTTQLGLAAPQARLLDRNGDATTLELRYRHSFDDGRQILIPSIRYGDHDLDGRAMAYDEYRLQLTHLYLGERWNVASNLVYARHDFDAANPVFGRTRETDVYGGSVQLFYKRPFEIDRLSLVATLAAYEEDSNIAFYDSTVTLLGLSAFYRF